MSRRMRRGQWASFLLGLTVAASMSGRAQAQTGSASAGVEAGAAGRSASMLSNPFANPYMNPYLNPYMTQQSMTPGNAALYFFAAQQASGGLGSGKLGGPRATAGSKAGAGTEKEESRTGASNVPGAGASRYFNRGYPTNLSKITQYHRPAKQYPSIRTRR